MKLIDYIESDPKVDPTHPDSELAIRHAGDAFLRLLRKYGAKKAFRLFGLMLSVSLEVGAEELLDKDRLWYLTRDLKAVGLFPNDLKPSELSEATRKMFKVGLHGGMTGRQIADTFSNGTEEKAEK